MNPKEYLITKLQEQGINPIKLDTYPHLTNIIKIQTNNNHHKDYITLNTNHLTIRRITQHSTLDQTTHIHYSDPDLLTKIEQALKNPPNKINQNSPHITTP